MYDPAIARWVAVDPLSEKMARHSAYNYCYGNPIKFVDPNGCEPDAWASMQEQGRQEKARAATIASVKNAIAGYAKNGGNINITGNNGTFSCKQGTEYDSKYDNKNSKSANATMTVTYSPNKDAQGSQDLNFIQTATATQDGQNKTKSTSKRATDEGAELDRVDDFKSGWYGYDNDGNARTDNDNNPIVSSGNARTGKSAYFHDSALGTIFNGSSGSMNFELYVIGRDNNKVYDGISWGFMYNSTNLIQFNSTGLINGVSPQFNKCREKWNEQATGPMENRNHPEQQSLPVFH